MQFIRFLFVLLPFGLLLDGCGYGPASANLQSSVAVPAISGNVHGGQQPVIGATIQLYAASTGALKGSSTSLLTTTVVSDLNGGFSITRAYTCPSADALVYLTATGGNPGVLVNGVNPNLALMAALGPCGALSGSTYITINELTTVASVISLAPFMADATHIGSDPANTGGLAGAFAGAQTLVNFTTGLPPTSSSGLQAPVANLFTLGDILAACVNSSGGLAGDGTPCGKLFQYATATGTTTADTITAMLRIVQFPAQNVPQLFALTSAAAPFQPTLSASPSSWITPQTITLPTERDPALLTIDTRQHIWIDLATSTVLSPQTGPILVYDTAGNLLFTVAAGSGGLYAPIQMLADPQGNTWTLNGNFTLSKFDSNGNALSPATGFPLPVSTSQPPPVVPFLQQATGGVPVGVSFASFDPSGNLWGLGPGSTTNCLIKISNSGTVITPSGTFCASANNPLAIAVATDGSGNLWVTGSGSVSKSTAAGGFITSGVNSNGCFVLNSANATPAGIVTDTTALVYDRVRDQFWGVASENAGLLGSDGSQIACKTSAATLPIVPFSSFVGTSCHCTVYSGVFLTGPAVDGAGTLWFVSLGSNVVPNPNLSQSTNYSVLNALDYKGNLLEPYNAGAGVLGLSDPPFTIADGAGDYSVNYLLAGSTASTTLAVDAYGNLWVGGILQGTTTNQMKLIKVPGLATPKLTQ